ncbi:MAG: MucB/RseB C-terminal domain-containing protein [Woeseia sp.]|nr:MucB/RseB C-terminal domain-containing protein [Woeseia sp.]MBT8096478.1 MucB/RseB C-terminal domain-containing protein [Woeseia sp.]
MDKPRTKILLLLFSVSVTSLMNVAAARERVAPGDWLDRMATVVNSIDYEGTVMRRKDGRAEALKVMHRVVDGVVHEKVVTQEGSGLEIIRNGNEVHCILPDKKSVLIEKWNDRSTLFSTLPKSELRLGNDYDLSVVREERIAGRPAVLLAIRPHDVYRFGHRLWLDIDTAFPLRTELVGVDGAILEQLKFADIKFNSVIPDAALEPSLSLEEFTWYSEPARSAAVDVESAWHCSDLPDGFEMVSSRVEEMPGVAEPVTHIVYSDGLATVSVFIASQHDKDLAENHRVGAANAYSTLLDEHQVTAVGEVPAITVQRIARSMMQQP